LDLQLYDVWQRVAATTVDAALSGAPRLSPHKNKQWEYQM